MEDVCTTTGNDQQNDRSADHFVSLRIIIKILVVKCNAEVIAIGLVSENVQEMPSYRNIKEKNIFNCCNHM